MTTAATAEAFSVPEDSLVSQTMELVTEAVKLLERLDPVTRQWIFDKFQTAPGEPGVSVTPTQKPKRKKYTYSPKALRNLRRTAAQARKIRAQKIQARKRLHRSAKAPTTSTTPASTP